MTLTIVEILALAAQAMKLATDLAAEGNRDATAEEVAALDAAFFSARARHAASTAAREAAGD
jgi:hypothetical protein